MNGFNRVEIFNHLRRLKVCSQTGLLNRDWLWFQLESEEVRRVYRLTSVYCVVICKYVNLDEDEVEQFGLPTNYFQNKVNLTKPINPNKSNYLFLVQP
jgi:hypothetical protein